MLKRIIFGALLCSLVVSAVAMADSHDPKRIMPAEVMVKMEAGEAILFLDTRNSHDWAEAEVMIPGAIRIGSREELTRVIEETPKEMLIVTYCT